MEVGFVLEWWHILLGITGLFFLFGFAAITICVVKAVKKGSRIVNNGGREFRLGIDAWERDLKKREERAR